MTRSYVLLGFAQELVEDRSQAVGGAARCRAGGKDVEIRIGFRLLNASRHSTSPDTTVEARDR